MRLASLKEGERDLTALVNRLYDIKGPQAAELVDSAKETLLRINPGLADLRKVPEGTPIVVPDLPDAKPTAETWSMGFAVSEMLDDISEALGGVREALSVSIANEKADAKTTLNVLAKDFKKLVADDPSLKESSSKAAAKVMERLESAENLEVVHARALQQLEKDLKEFINGLV
jgi:hypothetical protein